MVLSVFKRMLSVKTLNVCGMMIECTKTRLLLLIIQMSKFSGVNHQRPTHRETSLTVLKCSL